MCPGSSGLGQPGRVFPSLTGVVRPAAGAGDGGEAGTRVRSVGRCRGGGGGGDTGPRRRVFCLRVSAAGGCGDGGGDVGGAN